MRAHDRSLPEWFSSIRSRQITLPRFQRNSAWDHSLVSDLLTAVLRGLPTGAALILQVGDEEKFQSRTMIDAPVDGSRVTEQLLDGQQRLTALWRSLNDTYPDRTYLIKLNAASSGERRSEPTVLSQARWKESGVRYPRWVDNPAECWTRSLIPIRLLLPDDIGDQVTAWVDAAIPLTAPGVSAPSPADMMAQITRNRELRDIIATWRTRVREFNLPYLALPPTTPKDVAIDVFVKLNTSSVRLSAYDIVVALVEDETGKSLHDHVKSLSAAVPRAQFYGDLSTLTLNIAALKQDRIPGQSGYKGLDFAKMMDTWDQIVAGVHAMVNFLEEEAVYDAERLPSLPPLPVLAAVWEYLPTQPDRLGNAKRILRKYLWRSFLTGRYETSTGNNALQDFRGLRAVLRENADNSVVPILREAEYPPPSPEAIAAADWPKNRTILGRGLLALQLRCGAEDLADGARATLATITSKEQPREYHHLFPESLLRDAGVSSALAYKSVNCALISWRTNRTLSNLDPIAYLQARAEQSSLGEAELIRRLQSHLIPYAELAVGYADCDPQLRPASVQEDYKRFIAARAELLHRAARIACDGQLQDYRQVLDSVSSPGMVPAP